MASKQTYPCFTCKKTGVDVQVFLDGKDEKNHTKYLEEDGVTKHVHKGQQPQEQYERRFEQDSKSEYDKLVDHLNS